MTFSMARGSLRCLEPLFFSSIAAWSGAFMASHSALSFSSMDISLSDMTNSPAGSSFTALVAPCFARVTFPVSPAGFFEGVFCAFPGVVGPVPFLAWLEALLGFFTTCFFWMPAGFFPMVRLGGGGLSGEMAIAPGSELFSIVPLLMKKPLCLGLVRSASNMSTISPSSMKGSSKSYWSSAPLVEPALPLSFFGFLEAWLFGVSRACEVAAEPSPASTSWPPPPPSLSSSLSFSCVACICSRRRMTPPSTVSGLRNSCRLPT
mmetsp:Transcript_15466/g.43295  ORF Transcript_15466/g.43295 Transcript_15466/m.43295 type:complete len:262 (-) Transcript_15466:633-1418(-)